VLRCRAGVLVQRNYRFSKHSSVQSLLNRDFGKTGILPPDLMDLYNTLFKARGAADYKEFVRFQKAEVRPWLDDARRLIALIESLVGRPMGVIPRAEPTRWAKPCYPEDHLCRMAPGSAPSPSKVGSRSSSRPAVRRVEGLTTFVTTLE
jgi:hypothetical protein